MGIKHTTRQNKEEQGRSVARSRALAGRARVRCEVKRRTVHRRFRGRDESRARACAGQTRR